MLAVYSSWMLKSCVQMRRRVTFSDAVVTFHVVGCILRTDGGTNCWSGPNGHGLCVPGARLRGGG